MKAGPQGTWAIRPAMVLGLLAVLVMAGSATSFYPAAGLARLASGDGQLDAAFLALLADSQRMLGPLLLVSALVAFAYPRWAPGLQSAVERAPESVFALLLFGLGVLPAWWVQQRWFEGVPHVTDAISHLFQARIFGTGHLAAPAPPCPFSFFADNVIISHGGLWHTKYYPGHALWLAFWMKLGLQAWAMPVAWGATLVCVSRAVGATYDRWTGRCTGLLLATSPQGILLAASYMSHSTAVFWLSAAVCAAVHGLQRRRSSWFLAAGLSAGLALITRPQDMPVAGLLGAAALLAGSPATRRALWRGWPPALLGALIPLAVLGFWNRALFGSWLSSGYNFGTNPSVTPIIHDAIGFTAWFTPADAVRHLGWTLLRLNKSLLGWPTSLLLLPLALLGARPDRRDLAALATVVVVMAVYFFFPYYGFEYEARYHVAAVPFLVLLTVRGIGRWTAHRPAAGAPALIAGLVAASLLHAFAYYWPRYLAPIYTHDYEQVTARVDRLAERAGLRDAVVLLPVDARAPYAFGTGFVFNDPGLKRSVIYARDLPDGAACLREHFPGRVLYRFQPDASGGGSFAACPP